jgi:GABA(A) receptor-associated protein
MNYKTRFLFEERYAESKRVLQKYPDKIPIICEREVRSKSIIPDIDKNKYLAPRDLTLGQFIYVIRKRIKMPSEKALFIFINGTSQSSTRYMDILYECYKDSDGFLYITYSYENTFGQV